MRVARKSYANFWPNLAIYSNWRKKNSKLDSTLLFFGEFVSLLGHHWAVLEVWSRCKRKTFVCKFSTCTQNFHWWNFEGKICDFARLLLNAVICYNDRLTKKERYLLFCYIPLGCSSNGGSDFYLFFPYDGWELYLSMDKRGLRIVSYTGVWFWPNWGNSNFCCDFQFSQWMVICYTLARIVQLLWPTPD